MDTWEYEKRQSRLQATTRNWILSGEPNLFVTLTFRNSDRMTITRARRLFGAFAHSLKGHLFGAKSKKRILMVPIVEGWGASAESGPNLQQKENTHIHCLLRMPGDVDRSRQLLHQTWIDTNEACGDPAVYCPDSTEWCIAFDSPEVARVYVNYALKTCRHDTNAVLWDFVPVRFET